MVVTKKAGLLGDGSTTSIIVNHDLRAQAVTTCLYSATAPYGEVEADVQHTSINSVTFTFTVAPRVGQFNWVIQAI